MAIISFVNPKGGSGKSTTAIHLARAWTLANKRVLLIDADPQGSIIDWSDSSEDKFLSVGSTANAAELQNAINENRDNFDYVIIDSAGRLEQVATAALELCDLAIITTQPSPLDSWAVMPLVDLIRKSNTRAVFQITRAKSNTSISFQIRAILAGYDLPILKGAIHDRTAFSVSLGQGKTLFDVDANGKGATEINRMKKQIEEILK